MLLCVALAATPVYTGVHQGFAFAGSQPLYSLKCEDGLTQAGSFLQSYIPAAQIRRKHKIVMFSALHARTYNCSRTPLPCSRVGTHTDMHQTLWPYVK